jgi:hypothetical protein
MSHPGYQQLPIKPSILPKNKDYMTIEQQIKRYS